MKKPLKGTVVYVQWATPEPWDPPGPEYKWARVQISLKKDDWTNPQLQSADSKAATVKWSTAKTGDILYVRECVSKTSEEVGICGPATEGVVG